MPTLAELDNLFEEKAALIFPGTNVKAAFRPHFDLTLGDVGSELCQKLADKLRLPVSEIAQRLIAALPSDFPAKISLFESFINLRFPDRWEWLLGEEPLEARDLGRHVSVYIPAPSAFPCTFAFVRAGCAAAFQSLILTKQGLKVRLVAGDRPIWEHGVNRFQDCGCEKESKGIFYSTVKQILALAQSCSREHGCFADICGLSNALLEGEDQESFLWASPDLAWSPPLRALSKRLHVNCAKATVKTFDPAWYNVTPEEFDLTQMLAAEGETLQAAAIYLAGPDLAGDIDMAVPLRKGHASTLHFLYETDERYGRLMRELPCSLSKDPLSDPGAGFYALTRNLFLRTRFLRNLNFLAAQSGQIAELLGAWRCLLEEFNRLLAERRFRERLIGSNRGRPALSAPEIQILTSVGPLLSDMVKMIVYNGRGK